eukprot:scaffold15401_cov98-Isochrysis_galbana.AAC.5
MPGPQGHPTSTQDPRLPRVSTMSRRCRPRMCLCASMSRAVYFRAAGGRLLRAACWGAASCRAPATVTISSLLWHIDATGLFVRHALEEGVAVLCWS